MPEGNPVSRAVKTVTAASAAPRKGEYIHFTKRETLNSLRQWKKQSFRFVMPLHDAVLLPQMPFDFARISRLWMIGCGTAAYAGLIGRYWMESLAGIPVEWDTASEFRYRESPPVAGEAGCFISQSGETADTLGALRYMKDRGQPTLAVVNAPASTMARMADAAIYTMAGPEVAVASTKAFTAQLTVLAFIALAAARATGKISPSREAELLADLWNVPAYIKRVLTQDAWFKEIAGG